MVKETWYFSHDYHARDDLNMQNIIMKHGMMGVGLYWCLIEILHENNGYIMQKQSNCIAFALHVDSKCLQDVIETSGCFQFDDEKIWSDRVLRNLEKKETLSNIRKAAALKARTSNEFEQKQSKCSAKAKQMLSKCGIESKVKESKVNIKENNKEKDLESAFDFSGFTNLESKAIQEWLDYKKERRQSYKPTGMKVLRNKLIKLAKENTLIESINESISSTWSGIFTKKTGNTYATNSNSYPIKHSAREHAAAVSAYSKRYEAKLDAEIAELEDQERKS